MNLELTNSANQGKNGSLCHSPCGPVVELFLELDIPDPQQASCGGFPDFLGQEKKYDPVIHPLFITDVCYGQTKSHLITERLLQIMSVFA